MTTENTTPTDSVSVESTPTTPTTPAVSTQYNIVTDTVNIVHKIEDGIHTIISTVDTRVKPTVVTDVVWLRAHQFIAGIVVSTIVFVALHIFFKLI
jgi:hypothetical protein